MRDVERAYVAPEADHHRSPNESEIAERLGISITELRKVFTQVPFTNVVALDNLMHRGGDGDDAAVTLGERLTDQRVEQPGEALEREEISLALKDAIQTLNDQDRIVISLYYYEGLTLAKIGQVLGVTESRVCELHTKTTLAFRAKVAPLH